MQAAEIELFSLVEKHNVNDQVYALLEWLFDYHKCFFHVVQNMLRWKGREKQNYIQ